MKAKKGDKIVEVWQISHDPPLEEWVQELFDRQIISWYQANQNILLFPQAYGGAASVGFYFIKFGNNEFKALNSKRFQREFVLLE